MLRATLSTEGMIAGNNHPPEHPCVQEIIAIKLIDFAFGFFQLK